MATRGKFGHLGASCSRRRTTTAIAPRTTGQCDAHLPQENLHSSSLRFLSSRLFGVVLTLMRMTHICCPPRSPIACRYFNKYTIPRMKDRCEPTLCVKGAEYPIGTDEGRHATRYGGDGATVGYAASTDPPASSTILNPTSASGHHATFAALAALATLAASHPAQSPRPPQPPFPPPRWPPHGHRVPRPQARMSHHRRRRAHRRRLLLLHHRPKPESEPTALTTSRRRLRSFLSALPPGQVP